MRIIAGSLKGRKIQGPADDRVRPTSDMVKEALFSMVTHHVDLGVVVDLFTGTGNVGLEALSRGAEKVYFCDASRDSIALTRENIRHCGVTEGVVVLNSDWRRSLERISEKADLIFLDPPYKAGLLEDCISEIDALDLLNADGIIVAEHDNDTVLPESIGGLLQLKTRRYGKKYLTVFAYPEEEE
ncbi:MAG: 16S rRNA (guanine(966)-N(2))-methyltransferase RsmD [Firmicutes bacterium]|nr:16S rRNA (guanine(966)-N(2))-methyltransferase RsmD [Bacillota bacterium]